ncbi:MAG: arylesterase [Acidobacteriaceae bacterium]|jgi:acyl-CoA thioesterase-1|nr:arylesterase [Acidobacteriaceae bacterium]
MSFRDPRGWFGIVVVACAVACGTGNAPPSESPRATPSASTPAPVSATSSRPKIVALGDSLTAGLGLTMDQAYPSLLQRRIDAEQLGFDVVNAGVSGDTSAGGLSRLEWTLDGDVRVLIVALGGNDALRGLPVSALEQNLSTIIEQAEARHIRVLLAGMEAPPNFGETYTTAFHEVYPRLAKKYGITFVPFLLQNVAGIDTLNQRDGIHPTAEGARMVADNLWPALRSLLSSP